MDNIISIVSKESDSLQALEKRIKQKVSLNRTHSVISKFSELQKGIELQAIALFLEVASTPGITVKALMKKTGLSQASCSRNIALLSLIDRHGKPGLDLIVSRPDPADSRRYNLYLTPKGQELAAVVADIAR